MAFAALMVAPVAGAGGYGVIIWDVSEPVVNPDPVGAYEWADVSFSFVAEADPPCEAWPNGARPAACVMIIGWRVSLDGEWLREGSTHLAAGHMLYEPHNFPDDHETTYEVAERVLVAAEPGEHTVHVMVNWVARVPVTVVPTDLYNAYPCGLGDVAHNPDLGCDYEASGWRSGPVGTVVVE